MKKTILILIVVLVLVTALLVGCTAYPESQEAYQRGNGNNASEQNVETGIGYGNGNSQRFGDGDVCCGAETDVSSVVSEDVPEQESAYSGILADTDGYGSAGALTDEDLTLADMLTYAIQDEYLAHAEYVYIIDTFGSVRPFTNIIRAEEEHISQLIPLFTAYGIAVPEDTGNNYVAAVSSLTAAYQAGEAAEISNIAMYDAFLAQDLPDDVRFIFENLRNASENHLAAFRNHL